MTNIQKAQRAFAVIFLLMPVSFIAFSMLPDYGSYVFAGTVVLSLPLVVYIHRLYRCPKCNKSLFLGGEMNLSIKFCPHCGASLN